MKRTAVGIGLMFLLFAVAAQAQAPKPGSEQEKLEIWIGDWTWQTETQAGPWGPGGNSVAQGTARWILGGMFLEWQWKSRGQSGEIDGFEIDGYDPVAKRYTWNSYFGDGSFASITYTMNGNTGKYEGIATTGGKQLKVRGTFVFAADLMSTVQKEEASVDGKTWLPYFEMKSTKIKSSPK